jgi:hypothetical protein
VLKGLALIGRFGKLRTKLYTGEASSATGVFRYVIQRHGCSAVQAVCRAPLAPSRLRRISVYNQVLDARDRPILRQNKPWSGHWPPPS